VAAYLLPEALDAVRREFPSLGLKIVVARTPALLERLRARTLDLAVVAHSGAPAELRALRVGPYRLRHYGRRDRFPELARARTTADLARFPIVEIEPAPGQPRYSAPEARTYALTTTVAATKALVLAGFGVGDLVEFTLNPGERRQLVSATIAHDPRCGLFVTGAPTFMGAAELRIAEVLTSGLARALAARGRARQPPS
jgi:hypothetical protein